jgi:type II secretory ATPase GspE/PulE/Tfp pilus assembly ATPase PilB-like protein
MEILRVNDPIRELILARKPASAIREAGVAAGMVAIADAAKAKVLDGTTSIEELRRVIYLEE